MKAPPLNTDAAARLSRSVHLRDIVCMGVDAKHTQQAPTDLTPEAVLSWDLAKVNAFWELEGDGNRLKVVFPLHITIEAIVGEGESKTKTRLAQIGTIIRLEYDVQRSETEPLSEDDIPDFVGVSGFLHSWPYFRADVHWLTSKIGFPPLVLPVMVSGNAAGTVSVSRLSEIRPSATPRPPATEVPEKGIDRRPRKGK